VSAANRLSRRETMAEDSSTDSTSGRRTDQRERLLRTAAQLFAEKG
jgi:hypothetical protein